MCVIASFSRLLLLIEVCLDHTQLVQGVLCSGVTAAVVHVNDEPIGCPRLRSWCRLRSGSPKSVINNYCRCLKLTYITVTKLICPPTPILHVSAMANVNKATTVLPGAELAAWSPGSTFDLPALVLIFGTAALVLWPLRWLAPYALALQALGGMLHSPC